MIYKMEIQIPKCFQLNPHSKLSFPTKFENLIKSKPQIKGRYGS